MAKTRAEPTRESRHGPGKRLERVALTPEDVRLHNRQEGLRQNAVPRAQVASALTCRSMLQRILRAQQVPRDVGTHFPSPNSEAFAPRVQALGESCAAALQATLEPRTACPWMNPLADNLGLLFPCVPPRHAIKTVLEDRAQEVLRAWRLQGERVQPRAATAMLAAAYARVRDVGDVRQAELSAHIGKGTAAQQRWRVGACLPAVRTPTTSGARAPAPYPRA